jgi:hypothetical protein
MESPKMKKKDPYAALRYKEYNRFLLIRFAMAKRINKNLLYSL